jgi:NAD(P)-dependent dehydrogenase (short-subunit alcohol dehydrogenase family)
MVRPGVSGFRTSLIVEGIAGVVAVLVSDEGRWISGQVLNADGGLSARF